MSSPSRRGFALPLVILLALVAALAGALLLELQTNAGYAVNRQTQVYEDHHLASGVRELLDQWLLTGGGDIAGRLEEDALAFELEMSGGVRIGVYLEDAQGTVLRELSTIDGPQAQLLERVIADLQLNTPILPDGTTPTLFRGVGPIPVSVNTASEAVLGAIAAAAGNPDAARTLMREIRSRSGSGARMTKEELASFIAGLNTTPAGARQLASLLTAEPILWRMTIERRHGSLATARVDRTSALIQVPVAGQNLGAAGVVVLSWEDPNEGIVPPGR